MSKYGDLSEVGFGCETSIFFILFIFVEKLPVKPKHQPSEAHNP